VQEHLGHADALPIAARELADRFSNDAPQITKVDYGINAVAFSGG